MSHFSRGIRPYVQHELDAAARAEAEGQPDAAFRHLERAHVLGQASTLEHTRVHWRMLRWGWRQGRPREWLGQIPRLVGAATKTAIGLVPTGNTGGANVSPVQRMPIPPDLSAVIDAVKRAKR